MSDTTYQDRQAPEMGHWLGLHETWNQMIQLVFLEREVSDELKQLVFTVVSLGSGCRNCQSHGADHLHKIGVFDQKIHLLWSFKTSDLFTDADPELSVVRDEQSGIGRKFGLDGVRQFQETHSICGQSGQIF